MIDSSPANRSPAAVPSGRAPTFSPALALEPGTAWNRMFLDWCEENSAAVLASLSPAWRRVAQLGGYRTVFALMSARGGRQIYVPSDGGPASANPSHPLRRIMGERGFAAISRVFGNERVDVPRGVAVALRFRNSWAIGRLRDGVNTAAVAAEIGIDARSVRRIRTNGAGHA